MIGFGTTSRGTALTVDRVQVIALYETSTGRIRHVHTVTTLRGAQPKEQEQVIAEAKNIAGRRHKNVESFGVAVSDKAEHGSKPHSIDLKTMTFVPTQPARTS